MALDAICLGRTADAPASGKFVILRSVYEPERGYILMGNYEEGSQHRSLVGRLQRERGYRLDEVGLRVTGGGMWRMSGDGKTLILHGSSQAYGGFDAPALLAELVAGRQVGEERIEYDPTGVDPV